MAEGDEVDPLIGRVFASRYKIEGKLGAGAMGVVYRARHVKVGRPFAVKMLHERLLTDEKLRKRFDREAELAGKLHHVNVVGVVDVGETEDGIHFMVMEYADGVPLTDLVAGPMAAARVITLAQQLCEGLQHAHEHGLIHRDFKPDNVIVERDRFGTERPRIVDFGIAILRDEGVAPGRADRLTTAGLVLGTPHYMAPEHAMGDGIDHRIDLFALGVILYELLTGQLPFDGDGVDVARANLLTATPPMGIRVPGIVVDPLLEAFTRKLMQKDPAKRPQTAKEARQLLELIAHDRPAAAAILDIELVPEDRAPIAVTALTTPTDGTAPVSEPLPAPSPHTPSKRAVTVPERADSAVVGGADRRAPTSPVHDAASGPVRNHRAATAPGQSRPDARNLRVEEGASRAVSQPGRNARADSQPGIGADSQPGRVARADSQPGVGRADSDPGIRREPRAATQPGRERRAATVLPPPRRLFAIGLGIGLVVAVAVIVMIAARGGGSKAATPIDAAPIAIAPPPEVIDAEAAPAIDAGAATAALTDAAVERARDAATVIRADAAAINANPKPPKPPQPPKPPKPPVGPVVVDTSGSAVAELYGAVGRELKALDQRRGKAATANLWPRYLRIRINDVLSTPEKRLEAHRTLSAIRKEVAAQP